MQRGKITWMTWSTAVVAVSMACGFALAASGKVVAGYDGSPAVIVGQLPPDACVLRYRMSGEGNSYPWRKGDRVFGRKGSRTRIYSLRGTEESERYEYRVLCGDEGREVLTGRLRHRPLSGGSYEQVLMTGRVQNSEGRGDRMAVIVWDLEGSTASTRVGTWTLSGDDGWWSVEAFSRKGSDTPTPSVGRSNRKTTRGGLEWPSAMRAGRAAHERGASAQERDFVIAAMTDEGQGVSQAAKASEKPVSMSVGGRMEECPVVCNAFSDQFVVAWDGLTETVAEVRYGSTADELDQIACDKREARSPGTDDGGLTCGFAEDSTHFVEIKDLTAATTYYFQAYEGGMMAVSPICRFTTGPADPQLPGPKDQELEKASYGQVKRPDGSAREGAFVVVEYENEQGLSNKLCYLVNRRGAGNATRGFWSVSGAQATLKGFEAPFDVTRPGTIEHEWAYGGVHGRGYQSVMWSDPQPRPALRLEEPSVYTYYEDADGDGFGNPEEFIKTHEPEPPEGYVEDGTDCDDTDPSIGGPKEWYEDVDGDGYGNPEDGVEACSAPGGYVGKGDDCNDGDGTTYPGARQLCDGSNNDCEHPEYPDPPADEVDDDADGFVECEPYEGDDPDLRGGDCDDTDAAVYPGAPERCNGVWDSCGPDPNAVPEDERDDDADGYVECAPWVGTNPDVVGGGDCDDDAGKCGRGCNPGIEAEQQCSDGWDNDCDGFVDDGDADCSSDPVRCPDEDEDGWADCSSQCELDEGDQCTDCDDTDPTVGGPSEWYEDADGDGFGNPESVREECNQPNGYVGNHDDCDDHDMDIFPGAPQLCDGDNNDCSDPRYPEPPANETDDDADGLVECEPYQGDDPDVTGGDCDDTDPSIGGPATWYEDRDGDGLGDPESGIEACDQPDGYVGNADDCDDSDPSIGGPSKWYEDGDGDGLGDPENTREACDQPDGYVGNGDDCDDGDPSIGSARTWYEDSDNDGFGDPESTVEACDQPDGYVGNGDDCDDRDPSIGSARTWYEDSDNDGFGNPESTLEACDQPDGYVENGDDCNDERGNANPGIKGENDVEEGCADGIDNDCDGLVDGQDPDCQSGSFALVSPEDGTVVDIHGPAPTFMWTEAPEAIGYRLEFAGSETFERPVVLLPGRLLKGTSWTPAVTEWQPVRELAKQLEGEGKTVYWRVVAYEEFGGELRTEAWTMTLVAMREQFLTDREDQFGRNK